MTLSDAELLAGLAFLEIHTPPAYRETLQAASREVSRIRHQQKLDELRGRHASSLETSVRAGRALEAMGCVTVGDVEKLIAGKPDASLLQKGKPHRFGKKCLKETQELLRSRGLNT